MVVPEPVDGAVPESVGGGGASVEEALESIDEPFVSIAVWSVEEVFESVEEAFELIALASVDEAPESAEFEDGALEPAPEEESEALEF